MTKKKCQRPPGVRKKRGEIKIRFRVSEIVGIADVIFRLAILRGG
jgi:hypothetical protein